MREVVTGMDPSGARTGWAVAYAGRPIVCGVTSPGSGAQRDARIAAAWSQIAALAEGIARDLGAPCRLVIERAPLRGGSRDRGNRYEAVRGVSEVGGAFGALAAACGWLPTWRVEPVVWRAWWGISRGDPKATARAGVARLWPELAAAMESDTGGDRAEAVLIAAGASERTGPVGRLGKVGIGEVWVARP